MARNTIMVGSPEVLFCVVVDLRDQALGVAWGDHVDVPHLAQGAS